MAHYREEPCEFYVCKGTCSKGRKDAEQSGICQTCSKYRPRVKRRHLNEKKTKLDKIKRTEKFD